MYEPKAPLYSATLRNQDIAKQLDTARTEFVIFFINKIIIIQ